MLRERKIINKADNFNILIKYHLVFSLIYRFVFIVSAKIQSSRVSFS